MKKIAVFASGHGTNYEAIDNNIKAGRLDASIELLVVDQKNAEVIEKGKARGTEVFVISLKECGSKKAYEEAILEQLQKKGVEWIILAGYMKIISETLLNAYTNRIINIHPALLPDFRGLDGIGQAYRAHAKRMGVTIHYVDSGLDTGSIISQEGFDVDPSWSEQQCEERIHAIEHVLYSQTLQSLWEEKKMKRALVSVSDKTNLVPFVEGLVQCGYEIISTGGTKRALDNAGIKTIAIDDVTGFPEICDGRVKTLHPKVHGGLLSVRDNADHMQQCADLGIEMIDLVCVNLYPFKQTISKPGFTHGEAIENIDIGGPSMLRSAAKNHKFVTVVTDANDYDLVLNEIKENGNTTLETRTKLAAKVYRTTAAYDAMIAEYMTDYVGEKDTDTLTLTYELKQQLRYGENPHQKACFYKTIKAVPYSLATANQLHGKELSYNNIQDGNATLQMLKEFGSEPTVVACKHMNPCGIGTAQDIYGAWRKAYEADMTSIFGGIVAFNKEVTMAIAEELSKMFLEIILAPSFEAEAFELLAKKKNIRLMTFDMGETGAQFTKQCVSVSGGLLVQDVNTSLSDKTQWQVMTEMVPSEAQLADMEFGEKCMKHVKSNAIVIVKDGQTIGVGAGQMNRVGAAKIALEQAGEKAKGAVLASDAFFPMDDTVRLAAQFGIAAIVQPGGSIKDQDSVDACNELGIAMVRTGMRHFKH